MTIDWFRAGLFFLRSLLIFSMAYTTILALTPQPPGQRGAAQPPAAYLGSDDHDRLTQLNERVDNHIRMADTQSQEAAEFRKGIDGMKLQLTTQLATLSTKVDLCLAVVLALMAEAGWRFFSTRRVSE